MSTPHDLTPAADDKTCPDCAETIKAQANVCRYCGHRFDGAPAAERQHSVAGATVLSLVVAGLGQLYLGETRRGAIYLVAVAVCVYGAIAANFPGPALPLAIGAAVDAYQSARASSNNGAPPRQATGIMWAILAATVLIVGFGVTQNADVDANDDAWNQDQYGRCVATGSLTEAECANIYLTP